jgi:hypothetical protein
MPISARREWSRTARGGGGMVLMHRGGCVVVRRFRRLRWFRPFQRLLLAAIETRGVDCQMAAPLVLGHHLPLSLDVRQMVAAHLEASCLVPTKFLGASFPWHAAQVPLPDEGAFRSGLVSTLIRVSWGRLDKKQDDLDDSNYIKAIGNYAKQGTASLVQAIIDAVPPHSP